MLRMSKWAQGRGPLKQTLEVPLSIVSGLFMDAAISCRSFIKFELVGRLYYGVGFIAHKSNDELIGLYLRFGISKLANVSDL